MLKSARQALHTLQSSTPIHWQASSRPAASAALSTTRNEGVRSSPKVQQYKCALPGGFMCLNPNNETSTSQQRQTPPPQVSHVEAQASKPQPQPSNCFLPIFPVNAPTIQQACPPPPPPPQPQPQQKQQSEVSNSKTTPLRKDYLDIVSKDSRLARWQRVLAFVKDQQITVPEPSSKPTRPVTAPTESVSNAWDNVDDEEDKRSLWSGGSAGTNGVDEYVWDEDFSEPQNRTIPAPFMPLCLVPEVSYIGPISGRNAGSSTHLNVPSLHHGNDASSGIASHLDDYIKEHKYQNHHDDEGIFVLDAEENVPDAYQQQYQQTRQEEIKKATLPIHSPLSLNPVSTFLPSRNPWDLPYAQDLKKRVARGDDCWNKRWTVAEIGI